jgi:hypothetical protein
MAVRTGANAGEEAHNHESIPAGPERLGLGACMLNAQQRYCAPRALHMLWQELRYLTAIRGGSILFDTDAESLDWFSVVTTQSIRSRTPTSSHEL